MPFKSSSKALINSKTEILLCIFQCFRILNVVSTFFNRHQILYRRIIFLYAMQTHCSALGSLCDLYMSYFSAHYTGFLKGKQHGEGEHRALGPVCSRPAIT